MGFFTVVTLDMTLHLLLFLSIMLVSISNVPLAVSADPWLELNKGSVSSSVTCITKPRKTIAKFLKAKVFCIFFGKKLPHLLFLRKKVGIKYLSFEKKKQGTTKIETETKTLTYNEFNNINGKEIRMESRDADFEAVGEEFLGFPLSMCREIAVHTSNIWLWACY
ncbi:hypothetical protein SLEP1_g30746 [Rubroshorea leprosula]|uniref:Uncharacterized protein n=1 Tax=Rubroshorea leprosula TaxID=152421 RepID=A0AAV5K162_9ROSI|nr:hypothetical protein SLEP1_g30746 [Rubroshorea leprosula]